MTSADLETAVDWAAAEGWNPGLEDSEAFRSADPDGFLMGHLGDRPVAAISVVRHSDTYGFLGFYLCHPDFRGRGYGFQVWQAGIAHLGTRTIGLDGVVAQQDNYRRSGFVFAHQTQRHEGSVAGRAHAGFRLAEPGDMAVIQGLDRHVQGTARPAYAQAWFTQTATRRTLVPGNGALTALGTIRACRSGHKIGPLIAPDSATARALIESLAAEVGAQQIAIDIPDPNGAGVALAQGLGLAPSFACARMYRGKSPTRHLSQLFGEMTFELG